jgi:hypothetical protein
MPTTGKKANNRTVARGAANSFANVASTSMVVSIDTASLSIEIARPEPWLTPTRQHADN